MALRVERHENWDKIQKRVANVIDAVTNEQPLVFHMSQGVSDMTLELADLLEGIKRSGLRLNFEAKSCQLPLS